MLDVDFKTLVEQLARSILDKIVIPNDCRISSSLESSDLSLLRINVTRDPRPQDVAAQKLWYVTTVHFWESSLLIMISDSVENCVIPYCDPELTTKTAQTISDRVTSWFTIR